MSSIVGMVSCNAEKSNEGERLWLLDHETKMKCNNISDLQYTLCCYTVGGDDEWVQCSGQVMGVIEFLFEQMNICL